MYGSARRIYKAYNGIQKKYPSATGIAKRVATKAAVHYLTNKVAKRLQPHARINRITTTQHDTSSTYKKTKQSQAKLRKARFQKRVIEATKVEQPFNLQHEVQEPENYIYKLFGATDITHQYTAGNGRIFGINMGTLATTAYDLPYLDAKLRDQFSSVNAAVNSGAPTASQKRNSYTQITHNRFTMGITNVASCDLIFDVYQFVAADNITQSGFQNPAIAWATCIANTPNWNFAVNPMDVNTNGLTPLDCVGFGKYWKLLKKDRVLISTGDTVEMQMTGLHKRRVDSDDLTNNYAIKGLTQYWLIIGGIGDTSLIPAGDGGSPYPLFTTQSTRTWHAKTAGSGPNGINKPISIHQLLPITA